MFKKGSNYKIVTKMNFRTVFLLFAAIFLAFTASATHTISPIDPITGNHGTTVSGSFVVSATANLSDIMLERTDTDTHFSVSFSPATFSLAANENKTVTFTIVIAPKTPPKDYTLSFKVKSGAHEALSTIKVTVLESKSLALSPATLELSKSAKNGTLTLTNTGNVDLTNIALALNQSSLEDKQKRQITLALSESNLALLKAGESKNITLSSAIPTNLNLGDYTSILNASTAGATATAQIKITNTYCRTGRVGGNLEISRLKDISSDTEWKWRPLDEVNIEIRVRNNGNDDEDITISFDLYDPETREFLDLNDNEKTISIDSGKSETETFTIKVPSDVEDRDHLLYVKAFVDGEESKQCTDQISGDDFQTIDIKKKSREIIIKNIETETEPLICGGLFGLSAKVSNVGRTDEDKVKVRVVNRDLGIDTESTPFTLDEGDSRTVTFPLQLPQNASAKAYTLNLVASYDYDSNDKAYDQKSDAFTREISVSCQQTISDTTKKSVSIAAELLSEVKAGKQVSIRVSLKNTGDAQTAYTLGVSGAEEWATLDKIDPQSLTLEKGESKDVIISLNAKPDASGQKEFVIRAIYAGKVTEQKIALEVASGNPDLSKLSSSLKDNWFIWLIVIVNVILIILIIVAARRLAK